MRLAAIAAILALQAGDLATTWVGIHLPGIHEIDGTPFGVLVALKLALMAVIVALTWKSPRAAWVSCAVLATLYIPIIAHNLNLITR